MNKDKGLPWRTDGNGYIFDKDNKLVSFSVGSQNLEKNVDHIVECVNAHDMLLRFIKRQMCSCTCFLKVRQ